MTSRRDPGQVASEDEVVRAVAAHRAAGRRVVLTNGAFDLLHVGHVRMLREAKALGDVLVVAVNDDAAVRAAKGPGRPVVPARERAEVVAAVAGVDHAFVFPDATVDRLLRLLRPAVHAKGRDYRDDTLPERETDRAMGIETAYVGDEKSHASRALGARARGGPPPLDRAVDVTEGGFRGHVRADALDWLRARGLLDATRLAALPGAEANRHATRVVRRVEVDGRTLFVKVERRRDRLPEAVAEFRSHLALRAAGFRAPEPWLALSGRASSGERMSVLATAAEPGVALDAHLRAVGPARARAEGWARTVGLVVRALHTARFVFPDLLAHHLLLDGPPEGGLRSVAFLDLARLSRATGRVGPTQSAPGLAALALSLRPVSDRRFRLACLRAYLGGSLRGGRPFLRAIGRRIRRVEGRGTFRRSAAAAP